MKLNIVFGMGLDGFLYPAGTAKLNEARFGENGFLSFLEGRAGIVVLHPATTAQRIASYHMAMKEVKKDDFEKSFEIDPFGTAKTLLAWRDSLIMGGWDGKTDFPGHTRLHTLFEIEKAQGAADFDNGFADRLRAVLNALPDADISDIGQIALATPYDLLPCLWQRVLDALKEKGVPHAAAVSDQKNEKIVVLKSDNDLTAAEVVAERLAKAGEEDGDIVLIGRDNAALSNALTKRGLPALESNTASAHRSMLQVLPCLIEVMESPLSIQKLYNFLRLPKSPVIGGHWLAEALEDEYGTDGEKWKAGLDEMEATYKKHNPDKEYPKEERNYWLGLAGRYGKEIPTKDLETIVDKLKKWLEGRKDPLIPAAKKQLDDFSETVGKLMSDKISFVQLRKILDFVSADAENPYAEVRPVAPWSSVSDPAKILGLPDIAIWYDFRNDVSLSAVYPWTIAEENALHDNGVRPVTNEILAKRAALEWKNALRAKKLIVSVLKSDRGREYEPHPFLDEIKAVAKTVDASLSEEGIDLFGKTVEIDKPEPNTPEEAENVVRIGKIDKEPTSASSMQTLIDCPLKWYYHYQLGLDDNLPSLQSETPAIGSLAHKVVELLTEADKNWPLWKQKKLETETEKLFDDLVPKLAAFLSEKGREQEINRVKETVRDAVLKLKTFITENGLEIVGSEVKIAPEKDITFKDFTGSVDLLLRKRGNEKIVLDMKFSKDEKYETALEKNESVQLALYGKAVGAKTAGYFLMKSNRIVMNAEMAEAEAVEADLKDTWDTVSKLADQNLEDLKAGKVVPKWNKEVCEYCGYACLCGVEKEDNGNEEE